jgi:hypothetical protein
MKTVISKRIDKFKRLRSKMSAKYGSDDDIVLSLTAELNDLEAQLEELKRLTKTDVLSSAASRRPLSQVQHP